MAWNKNVKQVKFGLSCGSNFIWVPIPQVESQTSVFVQLNGHFPTIQPGFILEYLTVGCVIGFTNFTLSRSPNYFTSSDPHHDMLGGGCQVRVVRKTSKPGMFFFTIFACSCRVLSATQNSTCQKCSSKQDTTICQNMSVYHLAERNMPKHATTNMPNHVRIPPVKNK